MRRPLKPFVTEYKGNNRRQKDGTGVFGLEAPAPEANARKTVKTSEPPTAATRSAPKGQSARRGADQPRDTGWANDTARYVGAQNEDSYEAALRAADALFAGAPARSSAALDVAPGAHEILARSDVEAASPTGGRILRAIDEAPDATLADIEAERAPKRRGRKPGSKNKPKIPSMRPPTPPERNAVFDAHDNVADLVFVVPPAPVASRPSSPNVYPFIPSRGDKRFSWIRTKLGPGEQWKRRLPKLIW